MLNQAIGPSIWVASDGRVGNLAQVNAIANALSDTRRWLQIAHIRGHGHRDNALTLTPRLPWTWLPSHMWPAPKRALPKDQAAHFHAPWPTVWIGAGRRTAPYSASVRDWSGGKTLCVHILNSSIAPNRFDLLSTPIHDGVDGDNVLRTIGSPSYFAPEAIEDAGLAFADLADERGQSALVLLGGNSRTHTFSDKAAKTLAQQLRQLAKAGWRLRISASRRTPVPVRATFRALADDIGARYWGGSSDGPNPYLGWLAYSDVAIVTEDSANMLSDAAYFGLPIHIAPLSGRSDKFDRLHTSFLAKGCARRWDGTLDVWTYPPLREADRVADAIVAALLERYPQPDIPAASNTVTPPDWMG